MDKTKGIPAPNSVQDAAFDMTRLDDETAHRYRYWYAFSVQLMLENRFAIPGSVSKQAADEFAQRAWAESVKRFIGGPVPTLLLNPGQRPRFTREMADRAALHGCFTVVRPGETPVVPGTAKEKPRAS